MPQLQSIVLTDRQATPVNHTFVPRDVSQGVGVVVETTGVPLGEPKLSVSLRKSAGKYRARVVLDVPVVLNETINGVTRPTIVRRSVGNVEVVFDESSTTQERRDFIGMLNSCFLESRTLTNDMLVKLEGVY